MGRPCKLTPEVHQRIVQFLRHGNSQKAAAEAAGITERTMQNWLEKGEASSRSRFFQFFQDCKKAQAEWQASMVRVVERHAVGAGDLMPTWQAAAWLLERRDHKNWGRKVSAEHSGPGGDKPIEVKVDDTTWQRVIRDPDALRILDRLAARLSGGEAPGGEPGGTG